MSTTPDYHVIEETNRFEFQKQVTEYLGYGYEPVGQMIAETEDTGFFGPIFPTTTYRQAMLRKAKP